MTYYHAGTIQYLIENADSGTLTTKLTKPMLSAINKLLSSDKIYSVFAKFEAEGMTLLVTFMKEENSPRDVYAVICRRKTFPRIIASIDDIETLPEFWPEVLNIPYGDFYNFYSTGNGYKIFNLHDGTKHPAEDYGEFLTE